MVLCASACVGACNTPVERRVRCQFFDDSQVFRMNEQVKCDALLS